MTCVLGAGAIGCAPWMIGEPHPRPARIVTIAPPSSQAGCRLEPPARSADEPAPDDPALAEADGAEPPGAGKRHAPGAGKRRGPGAGKPDAPDATERDAPDAGERDAPDAGGHAGSDTGDAVLLPAAHVVESNSARIAFDFFVGKGLTSMQAAGIVGNLMQESGVNPAARQSDGPGQGIAQWSVGGRWNNLLGFAKARRASPLAVTTQLEFLWHELTTVPAYGLGALRAARSVAAATRVFEKRFEVCGACNERQRIAFAEAALRAYGNRAERRRA